MLESIYKVYVAVITINTKWLSIVNNSVLENNNNNSNHYINDDCSIKVFDCYIREYRSNF